MNLGTKNPKVCFNLAQFRKMIMKSAIILMTAKISVIPLLSLGVLIHDTKLLLMCSSLNSLKEYSSLMTVFCSRNSHTDRYGAYRFPPLPQNCLFHFPFHILWAVHQQSLLHESKNNNEKFLWIFLKIDAMYLWS